MDTYLKSTKVKSYKSLGTQKTYDLEVVSDDHNFYADSLIGSNSHSAGYSALSFLSVYLKFNHTSEFFTEALRMTSAKPDSIEEIAQIQKELPYFNIKLLPPDLIKSDIDFKQEGRDIRFGLGAIKGISDQTINKLKSFIDSEKTNKFQVFQAAKSAGLSIGVLSVLIQAGMLSSLGSNLPKMVYEAQVWNLLTDREKSYFTIRGEELNYDLFAALKNYQTLIHDGKPLIKESRFGTIHKKADNYRKIFNQNSKHPDLSSYYYMRKLTGFSYGKPLVEIFKNSSKNGLDTILTAKSLFSDEKASIVGFVTEVEKKKSKAGNEYCRITLEDDTGGTDLLLFEPHFSRLQGLDRLPKKENMVVVDVQKWNDALTVRDLSIHDEKIFMKLSDLKEEKPSKIQ